MINFFSINIYIFYNNIKYIINKYQLSFPKYFDFIDKLFRILFLPVNLHLLIVIKRLSIHTYNIY